MKGSDDSEIRSALNWFLSFLSEADWKTKKAKIYAHLKSTLEPRGKPVSLSSESARLLYPSDKIAWYLFLVDSYLDHVEDYEFAQGARILPVFKLLGRYINILRTTAGVEDVVKGMFKKKKDPDGVLFELAIAVLYVRNGWVNVEFLPEAPPLKSPDIHVSKNKLEAFIECKRMSKSSTYSEKERLCWLKLNEPIKKYLENKLKPLIIEIVFHVELETLSPEFIQRELVSKLDFVWTKGIIIQNDIWSVSVDIVDLDRIKEHLKRNSIKSSSSGLMQLIFNKYESHKGYSPIMLARYSHTHPSYLDDIKFAAGSVWSCDSSTAIDKKSRHILRHVAEAASQLAGKKNGIIHIALESQDGPLVETERFKKIVQNMKQFRPGKNNLQWLFCHIFDPQVPPDKNWDFGETVLSFSSYYSFEKPLTIQTAMLPDEAEFREGVFWKKI